MPGGMSSFFPSCPSSLRRDLRPLFFGHGLHTLRPADLTTLAPDCSLVCRYIGWRWWWRGCGRFGCLARGHVYNPLRRLVGITRTFALADGHSSGFHTFLWRGKRLGWHPRSDKAFRTHVNRLAEVLCLGSLALHDNAHNNDCGRAQGQSPPRFESRGIRQCQKLAQIDPAWASGGRSR
jgi:hypothetical protein